MISYNCVGLTFSANTATTEIGDIRNVKLMNHAARQGLYRQIEAERKTKCIALITGERVGLQTIIARDAVEPFVSLLDAIGPVPKLSLILDTNGGHTSTAWRIINLLKSFGDEIEVIVANKAMSAGTLMALGAHSIVMTKQAALGPIDPSLTNHALSPKAVPPAVPQPQMVPVSAEAVRGYLDEAKKYVSDPTALASVWTHLANEIHPLVLGELFRLGGQIRAMAKDLLAIQVSDVAKQDKIINLLCSDSGSHDYTINRRYAKDIGLNVEKCSASLYPILTEMSKSYHHELQTIEPFSPQKILAGNQKASFVYVRGLIEATDAGCFGYVTEGEYALVGNPAIVNQNLKFEGWRKLP